MPDKHGFDHLPQWGTVIYRCIEDDCDYVGTFLTDKQRSLHHQQHERARKREREQAQRRNLAEGRRVLAQQRRENEAAYGPEGEE